MVRDLHGLTGYGLGCRCDTCRAANTEKTRLYRLRKRLNAPSERALMRQKFIADLAQQKIETTDDTERDDN